MKRDNVVEILRFLACMIVTLDHFVAAFLPRAIFAGNKTYVLDFGFPHGAGLTRIVAFDLLVSGDLAVCIFFLISGYVLTKPAFSREPNRLSVLGDVIKRPIRLGLPLYAFCFISFICAKTGLYGALIEKTISLTGSNWSFLFYPTQVNCDAALAATAVNPFADGRLLVSPAWTLGIELLGSFLSYALVLVVHQSPFALLIFALTFFCVPDYYKLFVLGTLFAYLECRLGLTYRILPKLTPPFIQKLLTLLILLLALYSGAYPIYIEDFKSTSFAVLEPLHSWLSQHVLASGVTALASVLVFVGVKRCFSENNFTAAFARLGKYTFTIYLVHTILIGTVAAFVFLKATDCFFGQYELCLFLAFVAYIFSIALCSWLTTDLIDGNSIKFAARLKSLLMGAWQKTFANKLG